MKKKRKKIADLPSGVGLSKNSNGVDEYFKLRLGKRFTGGEVVTKNFRTVAAAKEWFFGEAAGYRAAPGPIIQLKENSGKTAFALTSKQLNEAADAFRRCSAVGLSLTKAIDFAILHASPQAGSISLADCMEQALAAKSKDARPSYVTDLGKRWRRFARWLPASRAKAVSGITRVEIRQFLTACKLKPVAERNMLRNLSPLFTWAVDHNHMAANPCEGISIKQKKNDKAVFILTPAQASKLLAAASTLLIRARLKPNGAGVGQKGNRDAFIAEPGELIPWLAVGLFAGLRPEEAKRLEWTDIYFEHDHIDLPMEKAKGRSRRIIPISQNLAEWLRPHRKPSGPIIPENFRRKFWAIATVAGLQPWPQDCLRHSYGSYHLALLQNSGQTAENMGHRSTQMLYKHYREVVKVQEHIQEYWSMTPATVHAVEPSW